MSTALSGTYNVEVNANQLSTGDVEFTTGTTYGWTSYGTTEGDLSGYLFVSMNYSSPTAAPADGEVGEMASGESEITGGSWSKLIFVDGQYTGSVYGKIASGKMVWNGDLTASISLELISNDGTGIYAGSIGSGTFNGIWDQSSKLTTVSGNLILNY